jgi:hypothetical protein
LVFLLWHRLSLKVAKTRTYIVGFRSTRWPVAPWRKGKSETPMLCFGAKSKAR